MSSDPGEAWQAKWNIAMATGGLISVFGSDGGSWFWLGLPVGSSPKFWALRLVDRHGERSGLLVAKWELIGYFRTEDDYHAIFDSATWASEPQIKNADAWLTWPDVLGDQEMRRYHARVTQQKEEEESGQLLALRDGDFDLELWESGAQGGVATIRYQDIESVTFEVPEYLRTADH
jgi:hypothetical protein